MSQSRQLGRIHRTIIPSDQSPDGACASAVNAADRRSHKITEVDRRATEHAQVNLADRPRAGIGDAEVGELSEERLADLIIALTNDVERTLSIEVGSCGVVVEGHNIVLDQVALLCGEERLSLALCLIDHRVDVGIGEPCEISLGAINLDLRRGDCPTVHANGHEVSDALLRPPPPPHRAQHASALEVRPGAIEGQQEELVSRDRLGDLANTDRVLKNAVEVLIITREPPHMRRGLTISEVIEPHLDLAVLIGSDLVDLLSIPVAHRHELEEI